MESKEIVEKKSVRVREEANCLLDETIFLQLNQLFRLQKRVMTEMGLTYPIALTLMLIYVRWVNYNTPTSVYMVHKDYGARTSNLRGSYDRVEWLVRHGHVVKMGKTRQHADAFMPTFSAMGKLQALGIGFKRELEKPVQKLRVTKRYKQVAGSGIPVEDIDF